MEQQPDAVDKRQVNRRCDVRSPDKEMDHQGSQSQAHHLPGQPHGAQGGRGNTQIMFADRSHDGVGVG